jgi:hypothetical protein
LCLNFRHGGHHYWIRIYENHIIQSWISLRQASFVSCYSIAQLLRYYIQVEEPFLRCLAFCIGFLNKIHAAHVLSELLNFLIVEYLLYFSCIWIRNFTVVGCWEGIDRVKHWCPSSYFVFSLYE